MLGMLLGVLLEVLLAAVGGLACREWEFKGGLELQGGGGAGGTENAGEGGEAEE